MSSTGAVFENGNKCPGVTFRSAFLGAASTRALRAEVELITTISQQPEFYHGWPTLALRRNGELLVEYSGGRESHVCPFGRVELIRSRDGGRSWSFSKVVTCADGPAIADFSNLSQTVSRHSLHP